jgi:pyruvate carboxylase
MTFRDKMQQMLVEHGLWPEEASQVMEQCVADKMLESMQGRWGDDVSGYPTQMSTIVWMSVKAIAVKWIESNKPMHFAKAILAD